MRKGEEVAAGPWQGAAAGEDGANDSAAALRRPEWGAVDGQGTAYEVGPPLPGARKSAARPVQAARPETFSTSRLLDFASKRELTAQVGHAPEMWPLVVVKELVDNALDAAEETGTAPQVGVSVAENLIEVRDNGPGISGDVVEGVLDFTVRVSSREAYVGPTRGAQGNALKTIVVMPFALDGAVLFVEKEGFLPLFRAAKLAQRYDLAIMSSKGVSTTAARTLIDRMVQQGAPVFCIRDFDLAGFLIAGTLGRDTRRYSWTSGGAIDLGPRLGDVTSHGLESEDVYYTGAHHKQLTDPARIRAKIGGQLRENGATREEIEFLLTRRVELNAFTSDQLIAWIESKLIEHGVKKVIPSQETLAVAVRGFARDAIAERYLKILADDLAREVDAFDPGDVAAAVAAMLAENPTMPWDEAVEQVARRVAKP